MGVSKQAVRKRFVPRWDGSDPIPAGQLVSRCTLRARNALLVAGRAGQDQVEPRHLVAGVLSEPDGLGATVVHHAGIDDERICAALDVTADDIRPHTTRDPRADITALYQLRLSQDAQQALHNTGDAARRLGHNFIGTEHILLGTLATDGDTTTAELAKIRAQLPTEA